MEPHTHDDIWKNYLKYRLQLAKAVASLLATEADDRLGALETNDKYAAAMAGVHYLRKPGALPRQGDVEGMAHYWKDNYNTQGGHGTWKRYVEVWRKTMERKL